MKIPTHSFHLFKQNPAARIVIYSIILSIILVFLYSPLIGYLDYKFARYLLKGNDYLEISVSPQSFWTLLRYFIYCTILMSTVIPHLIPYFLVVWAVLKVKKPEAKENLPHP
jgi:hypothetical protein